MKKNKKEVTSQEFLSLLRNYQGDLSRIDDVVVCEPVTLSGEWKQIILSTSCRFRKQVTIVECVVEKGIRLLGLFDDACLTNANSRSLLFDGVCIGDLSVEGKHENVSIAGTIHSNVHLHEWVDIQKVCQVDAQIGKSFRQYGQVGSLCLSQKTTIGADLILLGNIYKTCLIDAKIKGDMQIMGNMGSLQFKGEYDGTLTTDNHSIAEAHHLWQSTKSSLRVVCEI